MRVNDSDIAEFQRCYPDMRLQPVSGHQTLFEGDFRFEAQFSNVVVADSYRLRLLAEHDARSLPTVWEIGSRIPKTAEYHVNPGGTLCLGSPIGLRVAAGREPTLRSFADKCVVPYLFATSRILAGDKTYAFGELPHGDAGLMHDYRKRTGLQSREQIAAALELLTLRRRIANKQLCPCGCARRLGRCKLRLRLNVFRHVAPRCFYARMLEELPSGD